jgi:hypothetical protein
MDVKYHLQRNGQRKGSDALGDKKAAVGVAA